MRIGSIFLGILTIVLTLTVACSRDHVPTALNYFEALNRGDLEQAAALACEEKADEIVDSLLSVTPEERTAVEFRQISCSQRAGDEVMCRFTIVQENTELNNDTVYEQDRSVVFDIEDGRVCGFHEEVAN